MGVVTPQYDYATWVPVCPGSINGLRISNGIISFILAVIAFVFGIVIKTEYDSIIVYGRSVKTRGVSNALWLFYYFSSGLYFFSNGIYMTWGPLDWKVADIFRLLSAVFEGMAILACSLALNHHRVHKSARKQPFNFNFIFNKFNLQPKGSSRKRRSSRRTSCRLTTSTSPGTLRGTFRRSRPR